MKSQHEWDACRYVLDDPTLDRQTFEQRMLDDVNLALAVAQAASDIDALRAASHRFVSHPQPPIPERLSLGIKVGWHWTSLAALAATLLLAVGTVSYAVRWSSLGDQRELGQQSLAESWLAIRQTELVDVSSNAESDRDEPEANRFETTNSSELTSVSTSSDDDDWLIDAAREFYAQGAAG